MYQKYVERLYCGKCQKNFEADSCPRYTTKSTNPVTYYVCPECPGNYRIRASPKLKAWIKERRKAAKRRKLKDEINRREIRIDNIK